MQQAQLILPAPAKLNLMLHILGRREDGYHELQTLFQFIDYADQLGFAVRSDGQIRLHGQLGGVPHYPARSEPSLAIGLEHRAAGKTRLDAGR